MNFTIYDNIHGFITLSKTAKKIIDTKEFQRLRRIKQGGVLNYVFPTAVHTRFEHSIGTYHLANKFITNLQKQNNNISNKIIENVSIAGLCHDLGHVCFSHLFDDYILKDKNYIHEFRSIKILEYIISNYNIDLDEKDLLMIGDLIYPKINNYDNWRDDYKIGKFIFEIISNPINSIDVDKFDYLSRDNYATGYKLNFNYDRIISQAKIINDHIYYPEQVKEDIVNMFYIRNKLHTVVYNHKTVKAIEILIIKVLKKLKINIKNINDIINLTDDIIYQLDKELIDKIYSRKLPKLVGQIRTFDEISLDIKGVDIIGYKLGFKNNPLDKLLLYNTKTNTPIEYNNTNEFKLEYFYNIYKS